MFSSTTFRQRLVLHGTDGVWVALLVLINGIFLMTLAGFISEDSLRYVQVAHQMLERGQFLIPYHQGFAYTGDPPLLFWIYDIGWLIFGFNLWWPQLVALLFSVCSLLLTRRLARHLWPDFPKVVVCVPFVLLALFNWILFSKQIRADVLLTTFMLLGFYGLARVLTGDRDGWWCYVAGFALGGLTKGPVVFIFLPLPALLMPLLFKSEIPNARRWYCRLILAMFLGFGCIALWLVPAMIQGDEAFRQAVLFGHFQKILSRDGQDLFYYVARLPLWLFPWVLYWPMWRGMRGALNDNRRFGTVFCLLMITTSVVVLSLLGDKAAHYLSPQYPLFALLVASCIFADMRQQKKVLREPVTVLGVLLFFSVLMLIFPYFRFDDTHMLLSMMSCLEIIYIAMIVMFFLTNRGERLRQVAVIGLVLVTVTVASTALQHDFQIVKLFQ